MDSSSSSSAQFIKREEFNAFHKFDRALFSRLVLSLRRDIRQSFQVMSFLLCLEKSTPLSNLIVNLASLPDFIVDVVADEVVMCLSCLSYEDFSAFVASLEKDINSLATPLITRMTREYFTLEVVHNNRENILLEMKKHLTSVCYPAFEDIRARAEKMYSEEREKAMEKMSQLNISSVVHKAESSSSQILSGQQETSNHVAGTNMVEGEQDRTVFLTFSKGYPISEAEVHAYFTRRFGEIIEAIHMREEEGNDQALFARMVLHSAAKIPEILNDEVCKTKFTINGKHVCARRFFPNPKSSNDLLSRCYGVS